MSKKEMFDAAIRNTELLVELMEIADVVDCEELPDKLIALRARLAAAEAERDALFAVAVLAIQTVESLGFGELPEKVTALDHHLANELSDDLWERVNAAALASTAKGEQ